MIAMIKGWSRRRLLAAGIAVVAVTAGVAAAIGSAFVPAADTGELSQSVTVGGIAYERWDLVTLKTYPGLQRVALVLPETSRPVIVRAACRFAALHTGDTRSVLGIETRWTSTGGSDEELPDTGGNEFMLCEPGRQGPRWLTQTIEPGWLPHTGARRQLIWHEWPTLADAPSDSPASWALAVYTAR